MSKNRNRQRAEPPTIVESTMLAAYESQPPYIAPLPMQASEAPDPAGPVEPATEILIGYCGQKPEQADTVAGTGLVWKPGTTHQVPRAIAAVLLNHPDVWFDARPEAKADPVLPAKRDRDAEMTEEEREVLQAPPLVRLDQMTEEQLRQFAVRTYGERMPPDMSVTNIRHRLGEYAMGRRPFG